MKLCNTPNVELTNPINGGMNAPPATAIIISPEISFTRFGSLPTAREKIIGNMFAAPNPTPKMAERAIQTLGANNNKTIPAVAKIADNMKKFCVLINRRSIAPTNRPIISAVKNRVIPKEALSRLK